MEASKLISNAFNESLKIDKAWFVLALPIFIQNLITWISSSLLTDLLSLILYIILFGIVYEIIAYILKGNNDLLKPDFNIYRPDLFINGIKSVVMLIIFFIIMIIIYVFIMSMAVLSQNLMIILYAIIAGIIVLILTSFSGILLAHGINTNTYIDGIKNFPRILDSIGYGNFAIFIVVNLMISVAAAIISGLLSFIPFIGPVIVSSIISAGLLFYFVMASAYIYRQYVLENPNHFNENEFNIVLGYPRQVEYAQPAYPNGAYPDNTQEGTIKENE